MTDDHNSDRHPSNRALSNVVGFVLAFAVIVSAVGFVSVFGVGVLENVQQAEQEDNAELALNALANNFDEVVRGDAPRRSSVVDLNGGSLYVRNETKITVTVEHGGTASPAVYEIYPGTIQFDTGPGNDERIVYQNGAVLRGNTRAGGAAVVENQPRMVCRENVAILSLVRLNESVNVGYGGGTVRITGTRERTVLLYPRNTTGVQNATSATTVTVEFSAVFDRGWVNYLVTQGQAWEKTGTGTVRCDVGPDGRVYVRKTVLNVTASR
ncbi:MAG: hypothetical protein ABEJ94_12890 [Halorientalis sp.]